ncbi:MAG: hypothetical protein ACE37J_21520 [Pikeienuella sp.]|uniref:hypothetical protein n=1 Tax=Pikeienuella sp. TaxID=2831957 RepID=UPI00391AAF57
MIRIPAFLAAALLAALTPEPSSAQPAPSIFRSSSGIEVVFRNGCAVRYTADGRRRGADRSCNANQLRRADDAIGARVDQGGSDSGGAPEFRDVRQAGALATFRNGCTVRFDARGARGATDRACSARQVATAEREVGPYLEARREDGSAPRVAGIGRRGAVEVSFANGCLIAYDEDGRRDRDNGPCNPGQFRRADEAAATYRRDNGFDRDDDDNGGIAFPGQRPNVTEARDGSLQARYGNGCIVSFEANGRLIGGSRECRKDQITPARLAVIEYREAR